MWFFSETKYKRIVEKSEPKKVHVTPQNIHSVLAQRGLRLKVAHFRMFHGIKLPLTKFQAQAVGLSLDKINHFGGVTRAYIADKKGSYYETLAVCSKKDRFVKSDGYNLAIERLCNKINKDGLPN